MPDDDLKTEQDEVSRLIGRCILRLQQYEGQLKAILAHHDLSAGPEGFEAARTARVEGLSRRTLGRLVQELLGSVLVAGGPGEVLDKDGPEAAGSAPTVRVRLRLGLAEEERARIETDLGDLVELRNDLVHHFMARHDLGSVEGCRIAQAELAASCDRIGRHLEGLRDWARDMDRALQEVAEFRRSETFRNMVVHGILPDGTVDWPASSLVSGFREAAQALAGDGRDWVPVEKAGRWLADRYPDRTPQRFGCKSWPQALHESRLFDLRHETTAEGRDLCFRVRNNRRRKDMSARTWDFDGGPAWHCRTRR